MTGEAIFWPVLVQAGLTYAIYILVSFRRVDAVKSGKAKPADFRIPVVEPEPSATAARNLINQFELPVLFYVCCSILFMLGAVSIVSLSLAWAFVASRLAHAYVHVTSNRLRLRRPLFVTGFVILGALWLVLAYRLLPGVLAAVFPNLPQT